MDERLNRIIDYFEADDLVQLLKISTDDIVSAFEDEVLDAIEELEDIIDWPRSPRLVEDE